ncbi:LysR family transcriptional regulator [Comamonas resistens]|uniref:LysR family transcriptional regulator n=1 Tax=Comamonas resistens TaxID=3046670 RepID=A0ABY8SRW4_9BURK|nr:LysR family transcriptional regulator [Comamonas resistens]MDL5037003.1 LysR family transcriptional regulator [Comamonas resistens]WHS65792.1 LysR family transcriptional regulator [Comamonas resistens]
MDRLLTMRVFQSVADEGGFSAAARKLDMSVPTVTRLVADLEQHLGTRLMQRTTRSVTLTEAGEAYLQRVRGILVEVDDAFSMAQAHTAELSGLVRVLMPPVFAEHILAPLVTEFHQIYPKVSIEVVVESSTEAALGEYDITFVSAAEGYDANVIARPIVSTYGMVCASPRYLEQHGTPRTPQDLAQHQMLLRSYAFARGYMLRLRRIDNTRPEEEVLVTPLLVANHTGTLLRATLDGAGISAQPSDLIARALCEGQLVQLLPEWTTGVFTLYATMPSRQFMPARVRALLDFLAENTNRSVSGLLPFGVPSVALKN